MADEHMTPLPPGIMNIYLPFAEATTVLGLVFILETGGVIAFSVCAWRMKNLEKKCLIVSNSKTI